MLPTKTRIKIRNKLIKKQNNKCYYCNIKFWKNEFSPTLDHIVPFCYVWDKTDFVAACSRCNKLKWSISKELFEDWYICVNFKPWYDLKSYNKAMKVRKPINWLQRTFPSIFWWNSKKYKLTYKIYE